MSQATQATRRALTATEIITRLTKLNGQRPQGWKLIDGALEKSFEFPDFQGALNFVNAVGFIAQAQDHHPDLHLGFGRCTVRFNTHDVAGISISDFTCAAKVDALLD